MLTKAGLVESLLNELGLHTRESGDVVDLCFEEKRSSQRVDDVSSDLEKSGGDVGDRARTTG